MKFIDEYRDKNLIGIVSEKIHSISTKQISIMEICGGQTHTILKYKLEEFIPSNINLIHGPGCPVCVTPVEYIDRAIELSMKQDVILVSFGDMLRVPGTEKDLLSARANGADVRMVYSPLDSVKIAVDNPEKLIVFFAVGFETTAPANARAVLQAERLGLDNYFILCSHMLVPPAIEFLLSNNNIRLDGLLAAGHVCTVMGLNEYEILSGKYHIPIVAMGFEPLDIMNAIFILIKLIEENKCNVENQYSRTVLKEGNIKAQKIINKVFVKEDREWRGIGTIKDSGLKLRDEYSKYDALLNFVFENKLTKVNGVCIAGEILQGLKKPSQCISFGKECIPEHPLGAPMVSSEGACAAYFRYRRIDNCNIKCKM
ncbi:MAG: hydrogenase formation protein HypD [Ignavibacteriae bacterium]|nr:hydrogenase formation protein HypD [Ignavibacteriota bacterium]